MNWSPKKLIAQRRRYALYREVYGSLKGRLVLADMAKRAELDKAMFRVSDGYDTHGAAFRDGWAACVREIAGMVNVTDLDLLSMAQQGAGDDDWEDKESGNESGRYLTEDSVLPE